MLTFKHTCVSRHSSTGIWKSHLNLWLWANYKFFWQKRWQMKRRKMYSVFNELSTLVLLFSELSTDQSKDIQNKQNKTNKNTVKLHHTDYLPCSYTSWVWIPAEKLGYLGETETLSSPMKIVLSTPHGCLQLKWDSICYTGNFVRRLKVKRKQSWRKG